MFLVKLIKVILVVFVFLAAFFPVYINVSAFSIEPDEEDDYFAILDESRIEIHEDGSYIETTHVKYKILKENALDSLGEKEIPYLSDAEEVEIIKALVIKPDGRKIRAKKIQDVSPYSGYPSYTDLKTKIISMRNLAVGDIIELEYRTKARFSRMQGEVWGQFYFYDAVPMEVSRFILTAPSTREIYIKSENLDMGPLIEYSEDGALKTYTWERKNCLKAESEYMMPIKEDLFPYLTYSTIDDWQKIAAWYWSKVKDIINPTPEIIEETDRITQGAEDTREKIKKILLYFKENIRYVSMSFGLNAFEPHLPQEVLEDKYGDCKDQSMLLISMLKYIGIDAYPVLVRYGNSLYPPERVVPSPQEFKHVLVYADFKGQDLWLDPLEEGLDLGELPYSLTEEKLFVIRPEGGEFIDIPQMPIEKTTSVIKITIDLAEDGSCTGSVETILSYSESSSFRSTLKRLTSKQMDLLKIGLLQKIAPGGEIVDTSFSDPDDYSRPSSVMVKFRTKDWAPRMGDFMILPSLSPSVKNPFSLPESERDYPIQCAGESRSRNIGIITIPKGFKFEYIPENYDKSLPICRYSLTSQVYENRLVMVAEKHWFKGEIPVSDYVKAQDFFNDLYNESGKAIIIKKANRKQ